MLLLCCSLWFYLLQTKYDLVMILLGFFLLSFPLAFCEHAVLTALCGSGSFATVYHKWRNLKSFKRSISQQNGLILWQWLKNVNYSPTTIKSRHPKRTLSSANIWRNYPWNGKSWMLHKMWCIEWHSAR